MLWNKSLRCLWDSLAWWLEFSKHQAILVCFGLCNTSVALEFITCVQSEFYKYFKLLFIKNLLWKINFNKLFLQFEWSQFLKNKIGISKQFINKNMFDSFSLIDIKEKVIILSLFWLKKVIIWKYLYKTNEKFCIVVNIQNQELIRSEIRLHIWLMKWSWHPVGRKAL